MVVRLCEFCETKMRANVMRRNRKTGRWSCASDYACFNRVLRKYRALKQLRTVGQQMANACYNLANGTVLHPDDKATLTSLHRQWDEWARSIGQTS